MFSKWNKNILILKQRLLESSYIPYNEQQKNDVEQIFI